MSRFTGTISKIFVRPSALFGNSTVDYEQTPPAPAPPYNYGVNYEAVALTSAGNLVIETIDAEAGAFSSQYNGTVLLSGNSTAQGVQDAIAADAKSYFAAPNATVVYITDYKGWL